MPPARLWYNIDDLPKAVIRDLAHDGIRALVRNSNLTFSTNQKQPKAEKRDLNRYLFGRKKVILEN